MRISDWSSDVCSSDLHPPLPETRNPAEAGPLATAVSHPSASSDDADRAALLRALDRELDLAVDEREQGVVAAEAAAHARMERGGRKSVVWGKGGAVRVEFGGCRIIKQKHQQQH